MKISFGIVIDRLSIVESGHPVNTSVKFIKGTKEALVNLSPKNRQLSITARNHLAHIISESKHNFDQRIKNEVLTGTNGSK